MDRLVDQVRLVNQQLAVTTVLFVNNYMITHHFCQLLELPDNTIIVELMNHQCDVLYKVKILRNYHVDSTSQS